MPPFTGVVYEEWNTKGLSFKSNRQNHTFKMLINIVKEITNIVERKVW